MPTGKPSITQAHLRSLIDAEALIKVLVANSIHPRRAPLHQNRVNAIKCLLAKVMPDLKAVEQSTTVEGTIDHNIQVEFVDKSTDD